MTSWHNRSAATPSPLSSPHEPKFVQERLPRKEKVYKNRWERAAMKVFIKEQRILALRCRILVYSLRRRRRARRLSLGMSVLKTSAAAAENFEQVEQSGIEWSFGDLAE